MLETLVTVGAAIGLGKAIGKVMGNTPQTAIRTPEHPQLTPAQLHLKQSLRYKRDPARAGKWVRRKERIKARRGTGRTEWRCKDGTELLVRDMTTSHLLNSIKYTFRNKRMALWVMLVREWRRRLGR